MSRRGFELGPFPGINGVKAPFFTFALQNATKHLRMACKKRVCCKKSDSDEIVFPSYLHFIYFQIVNRHTQRIFNKILSGSIVK